MSRKNKKKYALLRHQKNIARERPRFDKKVAQIQEIKDRVKSGKHLQEEPEEVENDME